MLKLGRLCIGKPKADVLAKIAKENNSEVDIQVCTKAFGKTNTQNFPAEVPVYFNGLDFLTFSVRLGNFAEFSNSCRPTTAATPLDMGAAQCNLPPGIMRFEAYFRRLSEA